MIVDKLRSLYDNHDYTRKPKPRSSMKVIVEYIFLRVFIHYELSKINSFQQI